MPSGLQNRKAARPRIPAEIDRCNRSAPIVVGPQENIEKRSNLEPIPEDAKFKVHHRSSGKRVEETNSATKRVYIDPVIEQWYTDPHNRHDPDGPSGAKLRRDVLITALRNRGFRGLRVASIANWLVRCNGTFQKYEDLVGSNRWKTKTGTQGRYSASRGRVSVPKSKRVNHRSKSSYGASARRKKSRSRQAENNNQASQAQEDIAAYPSPVSMQATSHDGHDTEDEMVEKPHDNDADNDINSDAESITSSTVFNKEEEAACQQLSEEFQPAQSSHKFQTTYAPDTQAYRDAHDDWLLARLQRNQKFWNIIYGDDLDQQDGDAKDEIKFTYFRNRSALPTVDMQYPSQGLRPVKSVMYRGREVLTEDENFGLYVPEK